MRIGLLVPVNRHVAMIVLFLLALTIALVFPAVRYLGLFVMFLTGTAQKLMARMLR